MTFTDAAREVLRLVGHPLHYKEITEIAIERNLLSHVGKSPDVTMGARLAATLKKEGEQNPLVRVKPGVFALREWDEETIRTGLDVKKGPASDSADDEALDAPPPVAAADGESAEAAMAEAPAQDADGALPGDDERLPVTADAATWDDDREPPTPPVRREAPTDEEGDEDWGERTPDEAARAEMAAAASELFAEEEDDDQPILGSTTDEAEVRDDDSDAGELGAEGADGRRRRRRRRRRGPRQAGGEAEAASDDGLPSYTTSPAFHEAPSNEEGHRPQVIEIAPADGPSPDSLAGRELADVVAMILGSFERTSGPVSLRQLAEVAQRRGKVAGDSQTVQSHVAAATRADNARRLAAGLRPRFRLAGGRVGLTDWLLDGEMIRLERDAFAALQRYRDAARRSLARRLSDLPGHAFVELCLHLFERLGISHLRPVRFAGSAGTEVSFVGQLLSPASALGQQIGAGEPARLAIVIRKDGRDLGRERVTELRGSVHHYGTCAFGWILTAGQILSGAREEATVIGALPVTLLDATAIGRLCEEYGVGVVQTHYPVGVPDVDLFEAMRSS
jgi:hypothetical protein